MFIKPNKVSAEDCHSRKFSTCCQQINQLPGHEHFPVKCTDASTKSTRALRFASVSYSEWDGYEPRDDERGVFTECKHAADAFMDRLLSVER